MRSAMTSVVIEPATSALRRSRQPTGKTEADMTPHTLDHRPLTAPAAPAVFADVEYLALRRMR
ncbi:hypothetical protein [Streptomyces sp. WMMC1477]|uniref:hypothetical protein n=1 Tax=Streptomyces sp. WMMC1477 TaxID=3015155 RepID=UPI0022B62AB1|nr:hypothetical protein [Streptomyces sp. WMMC1477]MCZ7432761.1 hypothetical protein [Streptomyces sp. WMMC1477]